MNFIITIFLEGRNETRTSRTVRSRTWLAIEIEADAAATGAKRFDWSRQRTGCKDAKEVKWRVRILHSEEMESFSHDSDKINDNL